MFTLLMILRRWREWRTDTRRSTGIKAIELLHQEESLAYVEMYDISLDAKMVTELN